MKLTPQQQYEINQVKATMEIENMKDYCEMSINEDAEETLEEIIKNHSHLFPEVREVKIDE